MDVVILRIFSTYKLQFSPKICNWGAVVALSLFCNAYKNENNVNRVNFKEEYTFQ